MKLFYLGLVLIILGIAFFILSALSGEGGVAIFIIFPVFYSSGVMGLIGVICLFLGFLLLFFSPFEFIIHHAPRYQEYEDHPYYGSENIKTDKRFGGIVLIGPVPIIFGSDKNMVMVSVLAAVILLLGIAILFMLLYG